MFLIYLNNILGIIGSDQVDGILETLRPSIYKDGNKGKKKKKKDKEKKNNKSIMSGKPTMATTSEKLKPTKKQLLKKKKKEQLASKFKLRLYLKA